MILFTKILDARTISDDRKMVWHVVMILAIASGFANAIFTTDKNPTYQSNLLFAWVTTVSVNIGLYALSVPLYAYLRAHRYSKFWFNRRHWSPWQANTYYQLDKVAETFRSVSFTWPVLNYITISAVSMGTPSLGFLA